MGASQEATLSESSSLGWLSLLAVTAWEFPMQIERFFPRLLSTRIEDNLSVIVFDYGLAIDLVLVLICVAGIFKRGRNRRLSSIALALLVGGELLLLV